MATTTPTTQLPPSCKRCSRFLRTAAERERGYCDRCPPPSSEPPPEPDDEIFCCSSDPPCPSCPFVIGW